MYTVTIQNSSSIIIPFTKDFDIYYNKWVILSLFINIRYVYINENKISNKINTTY